MIEVKDLVKKYGDHLAVDHLNFTIEKGKIYGFLGPNGAGKSTTMNIMTGYLGATSGEVLIDGHNILEEPELAKKSIGYLPEIPPLYTEMTVWEYLEFVSELKKIPRNQRKEEMEQVVALTRLEEVKHRLIKNLSKGYKQRVGLAQAVLGMPEIIILDEPTVGLDPKQIIEIRELIRSLAENHTVILSSHILAEVQEVCDYIMIISKGRMVASDTTENLEHLMEGSDTIEMEVKAAEEDVVEILGAMEEITEWTYQEKTEGHWGISLKATDESDIREKLFFAFAEKKCPILMMNKTKMSLEQVFLELTESELAENVEELEDLEEIDVLETEEPVEMEMEGEMEDDSDL